MVETDTHSSEFITLLLRSQDKIDVKVGHVQVLDLRWDRTKVMGWSLQGPCTVHAECVVADVGPKRIVAGIFSSRRRHTRSSNVTGV
eukprot:COSAG01_NODE_54890_length_329_cov_0.665217_1_plen_86_part_01